MMRAGAGHYALEVRGDSMIEAGISDGDIVIIREQSTAETGDIVVALIEDHEATLKRFRRKGAMIALPSARRKAAALAVFQALAQCGFRYLSRSGGFHAVAAGLFHQEHHPRD